MKLRKYQDECIEAIIQNSRKGVNRQIIVMATGTGKTVVFAQLPKMVKDKTGKKTLILAHREELLEQAKEKLLLISPDLKVEIEQAGREASESADVVIASVPTIGRENSKRIQKFNPDDFGLVIVDECHHATSDTYRNVFKHFGLNDKTNKSKLLLGVTATAVRGDKTSLSDVFDKISFSYPIQKAIEDNHLVPIHGYSVQTETNISDVKTSMGDFALGELEDAINNPTRNQLVAQTYKKLTPGKRALVFGATVQHCEDLQAAFEQEGLESKVIVGTTPKEERAETLHKFKLGEIKVVISCGVLTEGFDCPPIEGIYLARPTKSVGLYAQIIGRGTRLSPETGKDNCLIVDFIDNIDSHRNSVMMLSKMFGVSGGLKLKGQDITKCVEQIKMVLEANPAFDPEEVTDWSDKNIESIIKKVSIFEMAKTPKEIQLNSRYAWGYHPDGYRIELPEDDEGNKIFVQVTKDMLDKWTVLKGVSKKVVPSFKTRWKGKVDYADTSRAKEFSTIADAFKHGDSLIPASFQSLVSQTSKWRADEPTEKQVKLLKKFGIAVPEGLTKGEASNLLSLEFSKRKKPRF